VRNAKNKIKSIEPQIKPILIDIVNEQILSNLINKDAFFGPDYPNNEIRKQRKILLE